MGCFFGHPAIQETFVKVIKLGLLIRPHILTFGFGVAKVRNICENEYEKSAKFKKNIENG